MNNFISEYTFYRIFFVTGIVLLIVGIIIHIANTNDQIVAIGNIIISLGLLELTRGSLRRKELKSDINLEKNLYNRYDKIKEKIFETSKNIKDFKKRISLYYYSLHGYPWRTFFKLFIFINVFSSLNIFLHVPKEYTYNTTILILFILTEIIEHFIRKKYYYIRNKITEKDIEQFINKKLNKG